jgi:hypothetical protein
MPSDCDTRGDVLRQQVAWATQGIALDNRGYVSRFDVNLFRGLRRRTVVRRTEQDFMGSAHETEIIVR